MFRPLPNWTGRTVACLASGPSLDDADCTAIRASGIPVVVTNTTFRFAPWADVLFGFDYGWWRIYLDEVRATFAGRLFCQGARWPRRGIEWPGIHPRYKSFGNSGACAISLAVAAGATRIVLLGYDCKTGPAGKTHHHGAHPAEIRDCDTMPAWPLQFARLATWVGNRAQVLNATRDTALTPFPRVTLAAALERRVAA